MREELNHREEPVDNMCRHEERVKRGAHMLILSRRLERLADHATCVAEGAVFFMNAKPAMYHAGKGPGVSWRGGLRLGREITI